MKTTMVYIRAASTWLRAAIFGLAVLATMAAASAAGALQTLTMTVELLIFDRLP